jgi:hypothetical protein
MSLCRLHPFLARGRAPEGEAPVPEGDAAVLEYGARTDGELAGAPKAGQVTAPPANYPKDKPAISASGDFAFQKKTFDFILPFKNGVVVGQDAYNQLFVSKSRVLYIWGRIDFLDVFGDEHWVSYCYFYSAPDGSNAAYGVCTNGNKMDHSEWHRLR